MITSTLRTVRGRMAAPFASARSRWTEREGLLLTLTDDQGRTGVGEASPLPGFSRDTVAECRSELSALATFPDLDGDLASAVAEASARLEAPAARHALETALFDLAGQRRGEPVWWLLRAASGAPKAVPPMLPLAGLIQLDDPERSAARARRALARGLRTLKLKIGRNFPAELEALQAVRRAVGAGVELRLDANRAWSASEARAALDVLAPLRPEFVEEPTDDLSGEWPVRLARDESLMDGAKADVDVWVLKPMALGGLTRCLSLAERARRHGIAVVVSHLLDGPVALAAAAALALAIGSPDRAAGLEPHLGLSAWPTLALPAFSSAHILRRDAPGLELAA
jgi:o-succinylbenzoate synthase